MLMLNYDFYDIHQILLNFHNEPCDPQNRKIAESVYLLITAPQADNIVEPNLIRRELAVIDSLDKEKWYWAFHENVYTYGCKIIKDDFAYRTLSEGFKEVLFCIKNGEYDRPRDLADALHNIPVILAENREDGKKVIEIEVSSYRDKWNAGFLKRTF